MHVAYSEQRTTRARRADIDATPSHLYRGPECCDDAVFLGRDFLLPPRCHSTGACFTLFCVAPFAPWLSGYSEHCRSK
jgi:hypothetical protein